MKGHVAKVLAGNKDAASCSDCHGTHNTPVFASTDKGMADKREYYTNLCISCHKEGGGAGRYGVFPMAVSAYGETYHGKAMALGYPDKVAGCADCHLAHNILPANDPASALNPQTLVETCGKCHEGFHPRFVSYVAHPDPEDPKGFLGLYLAKKFMIALLAGVFLFFWAHSLLWWRKAYAEKSCLIKGGLEAKHELPEDQGCQYVRRFGMRERVMHVVLILSFFGVVISGFPIKYTDASWAKAFMALMGGASGRGTRAPHQRGCHVRPVPVHLLAVAQIPVPSFKVKGWVGRLFGPDSLFPRLKDIEDCLGMFRWFFNTGREAAVRPVDLLGEVRFHGGILGHVRHRPLRGHHVDTRALVVLHARMDDQHRAPGPLRGGVPGSGVHLHDPLLQQPSRTGQVPAGEERVHGQVHSRGPQDERPLEYERILAENRLDEIKCAGPGTGSQLFAGVFGIASVILGLSLTALIFWAVFMAM